MAKFSISKLEEARKNPRTFALSLKDADEGKGFAIKSMFLDWQRAISYYHNGSDENETIKYFTSAFKNHFKDNSVNAVKLEDHILKLQNYIRDTESKKLFFCDKAKKISIQLTSSLKMTGLIPIVYLNGRNGYSACFFQKSDGDWKDQLKYPVLQNYVATSLYRCDAKIVQVGIYSFESDEHQLHNFSSKEINNSLVELNELGSEISSLL